MPALDLQMMYVRKTSLNPFTAINFNATELKKRYSCISFALLSIKHTKIVSKDMLTQVQEVLILADPFLHSIEQ